MLESLLKQTPLKRYLDQAYEAYNKTQNPIGSFQYISTSKSTYGQIEDIGFEHVLKQTEDQARTHARLLKGLIVDLLNFEGQPKHFNDLSILFPAT